MLRTYTGPDLPRRRERLFRALPVAHALPQERGVRRAHPDVRARWNQIELFLCDDSTEDMKCHGINY